MRKSGFHVQRTSTQLMEAVLAVQPTVIVSLAHDYKFWMDVKRALPDTLLIGRLYEGDRDWRAVDPDYWAEACAFWGMPYDAWITWNEPTDVCNGMSFDLAARHDQWCCEFRQRMVELGYEAVALNVPTGHFHRNAIVNLFPQVCQEFKYIGLHEYSAHCMWDQDPTKQRHPDDVPRSEGDKIGRWYCQRYRDWYAGIVQRWPERAGKVQMVVTECGVAYGVMKAGYGDVGWQTDLSFDQYLTSLVWYFGQMNRDDYCVGGAIFMMGAADPKWASFETLSYYQGLLGIAEVGQPDPPPENGGNGDMKGIKIYDFDHGPGDAQTVDEAWLRETFGDVQVKSAVTKFGLEPGQRYYKLVYLDARLGDANVIINVRDRDGQPVQGETVMFGWVDAPAHGYAGKPSNWTVTGVPGGTNGNGDVGPGYGTGAYYSPADGERGPHWIWIWDLPSDYVDGLGMLPGTNHAHLNLGYQAVVVGEEEEEEGNGESPASGEITVTVEIGPRLAEVLEKLAGL
jgi:hypothetical protein